MELNLTKNVEKLPSSLYVDKITIALHMVGAI